MPFIFVLLAIFALTRGGMGFPFIFLLAMGLLFLSRGGRAYRRGPHPRQGPYYGPKPYKRYNRYGPYGQWQSGCNKPGQPSQYRETPALPPGNPQYNKPDAQYNPYPNPYNTPPYTNPANPPSGGAETVRTAPNSAPSAETVRVDRPENATGKLRGGEPTRRLPDLPPEIPRARVIDPDAASDDPQPGPQA